MLHDPSGHLSEEIISFIQNVLQNTSDTINSLQPSFAAVGAAAALDGPALVGDIVALGGIGALLLGSLGYGIYLTTNKSLDINTGVRENSSSRAKQQAVFPQNPYAFKPRGLLLTTYPGGKNGRIIKWHDPVSGAAVFEWDEDFKYGSHYHVMLIEWDSKHDGSHYRAGDLVPEPWNTNYFGE